MEVALCVAVAAAAERSFSAGCLDGRGEGGDEEEVDPGSDEPGSSEVEEDDEDVEEVEDEDEDEDSADEELEDEDEEEEESPLSSESDSSTFLIFDFLFLFPRSLPSPARFLFFEGREFTPVMQEIYVTPPQLKSWRGAPFSSFSSTFDLRDCPKPGQALMQTRSPSLRAAAYGLSFKSSNSSRSS